MQTLKIQGAPINDHFNEKTIELDLEIGEVVQPVTKMAACVCKDKALDEDILLVGSVEREKDRSGFQAFVYVYMKFEVAFAPKEIRASMPVDSVEDAEKARHTLMNDLFTRYTPISTEGQFTISQS